MKIVCLGDSLTYGFPYEEETSWVAGISKQLFIETVNKGSNGDTTADMLERFHEDVIAQKPTHVVIMGGTNDAYIGMELDDIKNNFQKMISMAKQAQIHVILALMPLVADDSEYQLQRIREYIKELCKKWEQDALNFYDIFLNSDGSLNQELFCDDCHPNLLGYQVMTKAAIQYFANYKK